jgi:hypothetical protein
LGTQQRSGVMKTGGILDYIFNKSSAVVGAILVAGIIALASTGLILLRPNGYAKKDSYPQVPIILLQPSVWGNTISREHCQYNTDADIRVCRDLETGAKRRDVKDINGKWSVVAGE